MFIIDGKKIGSEIRAEVKKEVDILLATDVAARGLDIKVIVNQTIDRIGCQNGY